MSRRIERPVRKNYSFMFLVIAIGLVVAAMGAAAYLLLQNTDVVPENVYVNSIYIGGMTADEAKAHIESKYTPEYFDRTVDVNYGDEVITVDLSQFRVNAESTVKNALKSKNLFANLINDGRKTLPVVIEAGDSNPENIILEYAREIEKGIFEFNEDYTEVSVDTTDIENIIDAKKTAEILINNTTMDIYKPVDSVTVNKNDSAFAGNIYKLLSRPAKDASIGMNEEDNTCYIIPDQKGIIVDEVEFLRLFNEKGCKFKISIKSTEAKIKTKDLNIDFYQDVLGSYTSAYDMGLVNRTKNLSLAAKLVDGTVILPGKRFSYNSVVGKRSYERGFVDATVYTGEGTEEGVGGGICQVSSTIYCAQLRADLKTVSRTNHSYTVVYVPLGQDATVVYGAIDYIFENNTDYPIMIRANANGGYLNVKILGTKIDRKTTVDVVSYTEYTIAKETVEKEDSTLLLGETSVKQNGQNGAVVNTYKIYYEDGVEKRREFVGKSKYIPMNKIVLVGTSNEETEYPENSGVENEEEMPENIPVNEDNTDLENPGEDPEEESESEEVGEDVDEEIPTSDTGL